MRSASARRLCTSAKPLVAVFSGPQSTIGNTAPLITSNLARRRHGLPLRCDGHGEPLKVDALRMQSLAAPVEVLIRQFSEHDLAADAAELHGPPDGWCNPATGAFSADGPQAPDWVPCFKVTLSPNDGPYALPFMGLTRDGAAWDGPCTNDGGDRQTFFPSARSLYDEIDRIGWDSDGDNCRLSSQARFDFYRAMPPAGYTKGLAASERSDKASVSAPSPTDDIPPETAGHDFYRYYPYHLACPPTTKALLAATNLVQAALNTNQYKGAQWLESSCSIEETLYWLSLVIDTDKPIVGHSAQRAHGTLGTDGGHNIACGLKYIGSGIWATNGDGKDSVGAVLVVDDQAFSAREVAKTDARPGNYAAVGGHGGIVAGLHLQPQLTFIPTRKATWRSELNLSRLAPKVAGLKAGGGALTDVTVLDEATGHLATLPRVHIVKLGHYTVDHPRAEVLGPFNGTRGAHSTIDGIRPGEASNNAVGVKAELAHVLEKDPLAGFVAEGANPYAYLDENACDGALLEAVFSGVPCVRVARGNTGGFCYPSGPFFVAGSNLTSTKARVLLQAAILKLGMLPPAADPKNPTKAERASISEKVAAYQQIFDTH